MLGHTLPSSMLLHVLGSCLPSWVLSITSFFPHAPHCFSTFCCCLWIKKAVHFSGHLKASPGMSHVY